MRIIVGILWLSVLAVLLGLGTWQVQRLAWKEGLIAEIEGRIGAAPVALPAAPDPGRDKYLPVSLRGAFEAGELLVLVSSRDFGAGFRVIAPFRTEAGRRVMIDRGFIATAARGAARSTGAADVVGNLHWPDERDDYTPADDPGGNWWYARDVAKMAAALGTEPVLVVAASETDPAVRPMPVTTQGVFNRHLEYALTWYAFAAIWVVMTGFAVWNIRRRNKAAGDRATSPGTATAEEDRRK